MAKTSYPDNSINDDWNSRQPKPVTSFADDVAKAGNTPEAKVHTFEEARDLVETSVGAVPSDSETADAARDVTIKDPETAGVYALGASTSTEDNGVTEDSGATEPEATKSVKRVANAKSTES